MDKVQIFYNGKYRSYNDDDTCKNSANALGVSVFELNRRIWDWDDHVSKSWERRPIIVVKKHNTVSC